MFFTPAGLPRSSGVIPEAAPLCFRLGGLFASHTVAPCSRGVCQCTWTEDQDARGFRTTRNMDPARLALENIKRLVFDDENDETMSTSNANGSDGIGHPHGCPAGPQYLVQNMVRAFIMILFPRER